MTMNINTNELENALRDLIVAVEIIDGQESPPDSDDVDHLHEVIGRARNLLEPRKDNQTP